MGHATRQFSDSLHLQRLAKLGLAKVQRLFGSFALGNVIGQHQLGASSGKAQWVGRDLDIDDAAVFLLDVARRPSYQGPPELRQHDRARRECLPAGRMSLIVMVRNSSDE